MADLTFWRPLRDLEQLFFRRLPVADAPPRATLPVFVTDEEDHYLVQVEVPGVSFDDIEIFLSGNVLTLRGEKRTARSTRPSGEESDTRHSRTLYSEIHYGAFEREFELPDDIDPESVEALGQNGLLTITIGKTRSEVRRIDIRSDAPEKVH